MDDLPALIAKVEHLTTEVLEAHHETVALKMELDEVGRFLDEVIAERDALHAEIRRLRQTVSADGTAQARTLIANME